MRIFLSLFFVINIICLANSFAQENGRIAAMEVKASAVVTDNLFMLTIRNIDLINPKVEGDFIKVSPIHSDFAGMFKILGTPGARVRITYLQNELIKEENSGPGEVYAEYVLSAAFDDIQFQSALLDVGEGVFPIGPDGELYVWLGANLDLSAAMPGLYLSEFIIELEYI
jgi:hypothetical protein